MILSLDIDRQNYEIELAYREFRASGGAARSTVRVMGDCRGIKSDGSCLPGRSHAVYDIDFKRMLQINPASTFDRAVKVTDLLPGQTPWRDPRK